ncbi:NAD(+)/NADH kinase [Metallosphaera tengchongensis]|uniref:NAD(+)/NADH kinase n=1 Tax=Metallosphaera tengchongensis TaxID=1532350 RepID=A0A6N0NX07_9CREN|nr:NAD(+)/NADH kinase [Metallosphaera tengchongensis]QKR00403.1 NAD(+)/NADH kinase [Metallosphaera tengchongensis]
MRLKIISKKSPKVEPIVNKIKETASSLGFTLDESEPDVILAVGGDGTLLKAVSYGKPIVTIKAGRRGFLMDGEPDEIGNILQRLAKGDYLVQEYPLLRATHSRGSVEVFNEVGILFDEPESILVSVNYSDVSFISEGDGVLISTPQGSTGWSMSITGVYLGVDALEVTLVSPILSPVKSLIIPRTQVRLVMEDKGYEQRARVVADGEIVDLIKTGEGLLIEPSPKRAVIYRFFKSDPVRGLLSWKR